MAKKKPSSPKKRRSARSVKAKGRGFQKKIAQDIADMIGFKTGENELVESCPMSQSGVDIRLRGPAQELFPFSVECKRQESMSIPKWVEQSKSNLIENTDWLLICKQSNRDPIVVMDYDRFMSMVAKMNRLKKNVRKR